MSIKERLFGTEESGEKTNTDYYKIGYSVIGNWKNGIKPPLPLENIHEKLKNQPYFVQNERILHHTIVEYNVREK